MVTLAPHRSSSVTPPMTSTPSTPSGIGEGPQVPALRALLEHVAAMVRSSGVFGDVQIVTAPAGPMLRCAAKASAHEAFYSLCVASDGRGASAGLPMLWVALQTPARYLSQSIEADLVHTGDKLEDLLFEELLDLGYDALPGVAPKGGTPMPLPFEHFRDESKLYTFRSPLPLQPADAWQPHAAQLCAIVLQAYEACFRPLGDMDASDED